MLPGHGMKGKHHYISTDDKISEMYQLFGGRREIMLCCWYLTADSVIIEDDEFENTTQNSRPIPSKPAKSSKSDAIAKKISGAEEIMNTLGKIHKNYAPEQLSSWAHMIQMGKHHSYDTPPDLPYFNGNKRSKRERTDSGDELPRTFSPCKRVKLRSECIDQLQKWHNLLEKGGISKEQYEELQKTIMADMSS